MNPKTQKVPCIGRLLLVSAIASSIGSFLFGFETAVISGTTAALREVFGLDDAGLGFAVSSALFGAVAGAVLVGAPCERWGRVRIFGVLAALYLISALGCAWSWDYPSLLLFRFIGGLAVGGASVVSPMYITEIAPPSRRGVLVAMSQLNIVFGILAALVSNWVIAETFGPDPAGEGWRWMFGVMALPALVFLISAFFIPESPRWIGRRGRRREARALLVRLGHPEPDREVMKIEASFATVTNSGSLPGRRHLRPLLLVFMIAAFNQLDGINAILYYITDIFRLAGFEGADAFKRSIIVGLVNLVMTVVGMVLIDRIGRKPLLLVGSVTFVISHSLAAWAFMSGQTGWMVVLAAVGIVGSHAFSQGAVVWVCINELLPNSIRAAGSSAACFIIWGLAIAISTAFPIVIGKWGGAVFVFFAAMMVLQFVLVWRFLPETKGRSLEEIERGLEDPLI
jgi:sugar porter (SP) family MFS transporter